jgi:uncharacterized membrane protein (Fun14 family)
VGSLATPAGQLGLGAVALFLAGWAIRVIWRPGPGEVRAGAP